MSSAYQPHPQQQQQPVQRTMSNNTYTNGNTNANGSGELKPNMNGASAHGEGGYQGSGGMVGRFITPGGNPIDTTQPAFPVFHRR
jgi:hypothetical protein